MCRLYGFRANKNTKVECTLVRAQNALLQQSQSDEYGRANSDGWGIVYYRDTQPSVQRETTAAFQDPRFSSTAENIYARTVVAHVRLASVGKQAIENTHPFTHGRWTFAHNGTVTAFDRLGPQLVTETSPYLQNCRKGSTDSEQVFYWLLSRMHGTCMLPDGQNADFSDIVAVFAESIQVLAQRCDEAGVGELERLNFLLTDGEVLLASRWNNSLYWVFRDGIRDCEICGIPHVQHHLDSEYRAVVVASEPISQEAWQEVPEATILAIDSAIQPQMHPVSSDESKSAAS